MQRAIKSRGRKGQRGRKSQHSLAFKMKVAKEYLDGDESMEQVAERYGERRENICRWVQRFYGELSGGQQSTEQMTDAEQNELDELKKQNQELKKKLEFADMKATALELMIDIAEKQLGIDIRKKPGTKQP